jgi:hypothetical protein
VDRWAYGQQQGVRQTVGHSSGAVLVQLRYNQVYRGAWGAPWVSDMCPCGCCWLGVALLGLLLACLVRQQSQSWEPSCRRTAAISTQQHVRCESCQHADGSAVPCPAPVYPFSLNLVAFEWNLSDQEAKWHHLYHQLRRYRALYGSTDIDVAHSAADGCDWHRVAG